MKQFFITAATETTLLKLLSAHLPSPYNAETVIHSGGAWKDKKRINDPHVVIHRSETVKVHLSSFQGRIYTLKEEHVVFENDDILVVYKPCNLNVHAVPTTIHYHLSYGVEQYLLSRGIRFEATPITRLDRPVEGLVLFAKNKAAERKLFDLVKKRRVRKWYTAGLEKGGGARCLRIRDTISNDGVRTILDPCGKTADSLFIPGQSLENADIYSVFIFTGRRHQIRFHASHYIAPILGDTGYGSVVTLPPDEIALMCRGYNIPYQGRLLHIRIPPYYLERFYEKIKKRSGRPDSAPSGKKKEES
jgi:23S rRNA pseudouridine1911/1915/1917 synthase